MLAFSDFGLMIVFYCTVMAKKCIGGGEVFHDCFVFVALGILNDFTTSLSRQDIGHGQIQQPSCF